MKRSLSGLVVALALTACKEEPRGKMEPIAHPPTPAGATAAPAAKPAAAEVVPAEGAVLLRWKLAKGEPRAFRLSFTPEAAAPASEPAAPPSRADKKKGRDPKAKAEAPEPAPLMTPTELTYLLERTSSGDALLRITPASGAPDEASLSDRGFVLEGLQGATRNTATLLLELPRDAVRVGDTWSLATELVVPDVFGRDFHRSAGERHNRVKLTALTPAENGEQVAVIEYDLGEQLSGIVPPGYKPPDARPGSDEGKKTAGSQDVAVDVKVTARGEFLVKAGHWRTWEGTFATVTKGPARAAAQLPAGTQKVRLTALDAAPAAPATPPPAAAQPAAP
ncbi:hypothetical protein KRR26_01410 [Corallococcus sp. M34]|uniref:hypothetical protein n=1 Tax=Citreicoccus inhibens TaxID=2849499 RepID=UPI001C251052|nr:hypothetical protein [Citreicoccus inhibens]MBU8894239.1 hypothetical protein [Citreicoccus inhibens]